MQTISKSALRKQLLKIRSELPAEYCRTADRAILQNLLAMAEYRQADTIFTYVSTKEEVDTRNLLEHALSQKKTVAVPRCLEKGIMKAYRITHLEELHPGKYGILEPSEECEELRPWEIDLAVIPCVACSRNGIRLGYGGGYYDRYLPQTSACKIVLCRQQMLWDNVPQEPHDCPVDMVITETGIFTKNPEIHLP